MKDMDKYVEEKAKEFIGGFWRQDIGDVDYAKDFIRTLLKEIEDKYWANEQYHLDTIRELKKQIDERK